MRVMDRPIGVWLLSEKPLDPPPGGRDAACFNAVVVDEHDAVEFLLCAGPHNTMRRLVLVRAAEEELLERFGPTSTDVLEAVRALDALHLSGD
jgi:hypothetical protein